MGFLGMSGKTWKKIGGYALKAAPIVAAPFTGGASLLALGAGAGALSGAMDGGGWKGALMGGALGAIPGGGAGGAAASGATKVGLKEIAKGVGKGALTNFATGTGVGLATGQGLKSSLAGGGQGALSGIGSSGGAGGFKQAAKTVGKNVAIGAGSNYAARGLQKAGVPGELAGQGANVFTNYLGNQFNPQAQQQPGQAPGQPGGRTGISSYLPQQAQSTLSGTWKDRIRTAGTGALQGAQNGGGFSGALQGAQQNLTGVSLPGGGAGGGQGVAPTSGGPTNFGRGIVANPVFTGGGGTPTPGRPTSGTTGPMYPNSAPASSGRAPQAATAPAPSQQAPAQQSAAAGPVINTPGQKPATWSERYGPLIAQGAGVVLGGYAGKKATEMAQKRSPEELAALQGAQGAAGQAGKLGAELGQQGQDYLQKPGQYFQTLLNGSRGAMSMATAGPNAQITGNYRGAERALNQAGVRGASRDQAVADLNRQRVSQIAGLTTGMQPYAAEQLAAMGQGTLGQAGGLMATSGNIYGNLLGQGAHNREYARGEGEKTATAIGGLARDVGEVAFKRPQDGGTPKAPKAPPKLPKNTPPGKMPPIGQPIPNPTVPTAPAPAGQPTTPPVWGQPIPNPTVPQAPLPDWYQPQRNSNPWNVQF